MARKLPKNSGKSVAKKGTLKRLLKILFHNFKLELVVVTICLMLAAVSNITSSVFVKYITDEIIFTIKNQVPFETYIISFTKLLVIMGSLYLIGLIASFIWNRTMAITTQKYLNILRKEMFNHMESLPIKYFDTNAHGDIMSLYTNDIDSIRQLISQALPVLFQTAFIVISLLVIMITFSIWLALIVLAGAIFMFLNAKIIGGNSAKFFVKQQKAIGVTEGNIEETIKGLKVVKVFSHEEKSQEQFEEINDHLGKVSAKATTYGNLIFPIMSNIGNFIYGILVLVGSVLLVFDVPNLTLTGFQKMDYGVIVSFLLMCRMFTNNIANLSQQVTFIVMAIAGASRVFDLLDEKPEVDEGYVSLVHIKYLENGEFVETDERTRDYAWKHPHSDGTTTYTELKGDILLHDVDFGYTENKLVLHDINIYAHPGQKIAFVGATGAGKTTITNLINRFYDIADGKIRYDGININKIKKADLRKSLGIVLQETNLFTGTVMENIRYGRLSATDEEVIEAAKIANAYDFIMRLPDGFDTVLEGDGANLSQGQRQLISIARAAVKDAPVMILDEATSSIDTRTEKLVQDGTDKLMEGRTVFVIAHRLSTVRNSDAIMVLSEGRIVERGDHDDLISQKGIYYQLYTGAFELE